MEYIICPDCQTKNMSGTAACVGCGLSLLGVPAQSVTALLFPEEQGERGVCGKCGSDKIIPRLRVVDRNSKNDLSLEIAEHPEALLFRGLRYIILTARVCGQCGYTELYTSDPEYLYELYQKAYASPEQEDQERQELLRPAEAIVEGHPEELLRPAQAGTPSHPEELLRSSSSEEREKE